MRKFYVAILMCFALLLALIAPLRAHADEENYDKMRLGVGLGCPLIIFPLPGLHLNFQYSFTSFYRMGIEGRLGYYPPAFLMPTVLWMHEFVWRNEGRWFELIPRFGIGYQVFTMANGVWSSQDGDGKSIVREHGLAFNFGIGFGWVITDLILLQLNLDYVLVPLLDKRSRKKEYIYHQVHPAFNVVFRL